MARCVIVLVLVAAVLFTSVAYAQYGQPVGPQPQKQWRRPAGPQPQKQAEQVLATEEDKKSPFDLNISIFFKNFNYKEDVAPPLKSNENGWVPGLRLFGAGNFRNKDGINTELFFRGHIHYSEGVTVYDGSTMTGIPLKDTTKNVFHGWEMSLGYTFWQQPDKTKPRLNTYSPYAGITMDVWERKLGGPTPYKEVYDWGYFIIGCFSRFDLDEKWSLGVDFTIKLWAYGDIMIDMSKSMGIPKTTLDLGKKHGWKLQLFFVQKKGSPVFYSIWYEEYGFGMSDVDITYGIFEPASTTKQIGVSVGWRF